jgi:hypothetical protein
MMQLGGVLVRVPGAFVFFRELGGPAFVGLGVAIPGEALEKGGILSFV